MFRYSLDSFIASKQKEEADKVFESLGEKCTLIHSELLDTIFTNNRITYDYLESFVNIIKETKGEKITMVVIPRNSMSYRALRDMKYGFEAIDKSWRDPIPYIEHSFPEDYADRNPHGPDWMHCYICFFTKYHQASASEECVAYYLSKVNSMKAFT
jgi:hypothetical protein